MPAKNILEELEWRGLVKQVTNADRILEAEQNHQGIYCGFDPTADSLHVGHLLPLITLERFNQFGLKPIALIGGGTGMIGDPSFKSAERVLQTDEEVQINSQAIQIQIETMLPQIQVMNNASWLAPLTLIDFLREVGKDFTLGYLLAKESIARRISTGLSITEFSYTMLQAYDFYQLYTNADCPLQLGGSDQWGNITSGTDYIGTKVGRDKTKAAGLTMQLLTKSDGKKFGKTESGAIWLDANKTSVYEFYQFWLNQDDQESEQMLKFLTFLDEEKIQQLVAESQKNPQERLMQKTLAQELTKFVHGEAGLDEAIKVSEALFQGDLLTLSEASFSMAFKTIEHLSLPDKTTVIDALVAVKAASSKREAREFINAQAININNQLVTNETEPLSKFSPLHGKYLIIKRGKKKFFGIEINN